MENLKEMSFTKLLEYFVDCVIGYMEIGDISKEEYLAVKKEILDRYSKSCNKRTK